MTGPEQWTPDLPGDQGGPEDQGSPDGPSVPADLPGAGPAGERPGTRRRRGWLIGSGALVVVAVGGIVLGLLLGGGSSGSPTDRPTAATDTPGPGGPTAGPPSAGPGTTLSASEERLLGQLEPFTVTDCQGAPPDADGVDAALSCAPGVADQASGPDRLLISHYRDASALAADVARRTAAITDVGSCSRGEASTEQVIHNAHRVGSFLCTTAPGRFSIFWTADSELVAFAAQSGDAEKLMAWWRGFRPI